jgi:ribosome maturation factor RimP
MRESLIRLLEPEVAALGYELVELEFAAHRGGGILRLYIDRSGAGIGIADCEQVSRRVGAVLDAADPIRGAYTLEVSSPGSDRPLRTPAHYERALGERVWVELTPRGGRRRYTGRLARVRDGQIELEVDGQPVALALIDIQRARLAPLN